MKSKKSQMFDTLGILLALSIPLPLPSAASAAEAYPSEPVRLIIPFSPGGGADIVGRLIATNLSKRLGELVIPDNRPGAGSMIGTEMVAKARPDGLTLLLASTSNTIIPALQKLSFDPVKAFAPIAKLGYASSALFVHPSVPANSVKELIALAKQKPGQLTAGGAGIASNNHLSAELFKAMANIDFLIAQFKGAGPAMIDLLGGHIHFFIGSITQGLPHVKSGTLRMLGTSGSKRSAALPDVPTIAEAGVPGYEAISWYGILAPAGVPAPIVDRLDKEVKAILASDEVKKGFLRLGVEVDYIGPTEFWTYLTGEIAKMARVIKEANIKAEN